MLTTRTITNAGAPLYSPSGDLLVGVSIVFWLADAGGRQTDAWDATTNERVGGDPITVVTDAQGEFSVDLWPNSRGNRTTRYKCKVQSEGFREFAGIVEDVPGDLPWVDFMLSGGTMTAQDLSAISAAIASHVATADPHTQYAKESDLGDSSALDVGTTAGTVAAGDDPRLSDSRTPNGGAGGVLSGSYPNPGFAVDMATQAELDAVEAAKVDKVTGKGLSTEDYSTSEKAKLAGIAAGAQVNVATNIAQGTRTTTAVPLTSSTGTGATLDAATASLAGVMAAADKSKLDGIAAGANNYSHPANHLPSIITQDSSNRFVTDAEKATWNAKANTASPTFTGTVNGITKAMVGLGSVDNTSDASKPVSTAQAAAIDTATAIHPFLLIGA